MFVIEIEEAKKTAENTPVPVTTPTTTSAATPDYAAGLSSTPAYAPMTPQPAAVLTGMHKDINKIYKIIQFY